jgi:uncharacterized RDD family membrane protein YckC
VTTAQHPTSDPTAVLGRRAGAYVVDWLVLAAIPIAIFFASAGVTLWESPLTCAQIEASGEFDPSGRTCIDDIDVTLGDDEYNAVTFRTIAPILAGGFALLYLVVVQWILQGLTGATLGKAVFGIRTVNAGGTGPGLGKQLVRGLLWIVDGFPASLCAFPIPVVAALTAGLSRGHRRVGDMAAGTYVVRSTERGRPVVIPEKATTPPRPPTTPAAPGGPAPDATPPPSGFAAPTATSTADDQPGYAAPAPSPADDTSPTPPPPSGPQWDADRNAYIQWDPDRGSWLVFDNDTQEWRPLS